jgi:hypothetical protein
MRYFSRWIGSVVRLARTLAWGLLVLYVCGLRAALAEEPTASAKPEHAVVIDLGIPWTDTAWSPDSRFRSENAIMGSAEGRLRFRVFDKAMHHVWVRRLNLPIDMTQYPILALTYRAKDVPAQPKLYVLFIDDSSGVSAAGGLWGMSTTELVSDGQTHVFRRDLREKKPKGPIARLALGVQAGQVSPGVLELLDLRFETAPGETVKVEEDPPVSFEVTDVEGKPLAGALVTIDGERSSFARAKKTNEKGLATLTPLQNETGKHAIRVECDGLVPMEWVTNRQPDAPLPVALPRGTICGGVIQDEAGKPIEGVKVFIAGPRAEHTLVTDTHGRWKSPPMPPFTDGILFLRLSHPDYVSEPLRTDASDTSNASVQAGEAVHVLKRRTPDEDVVLN